MSEKTTIKITKATEKDMPALLRMVRREAEYEKMIDSFSATEESLRAGLCGDGAPAEAIIAWAGEEPVGFCTFHTTFATFSATRGFYMEDLFVEEKWRGHGIGRKLLSHLAALALERGYRSISWSVFKWNENAIGFYRSTGAEELQAWDHFSLSGDALNKMASKYSH